MVAFTKAEDVEDSTINELEILELGGYGRNEQHTSNPILDPTMIKERNARAMSTDLAKLLRASSSSNPAQVCHSVQF